ncbi:MAG: hypothetical protein LW821_02500 [Flammeovirgaceae bacterium]|jgi:hypothetical protein|nr:hypothetical protein [Flammeovirgaceae bacterium]
MNIIDNINQNEFLEKVSKSFSNTGTIYISVLGWKDWDYFVEFCKEDGGIEEAQIEVYKSLPLSHKVSSLEELIDLVFKFTRFPYLSSINGNYRYFYDIHIWPISHYFIFNFYLKKCIIKDRNFFSKIFSPVTIPSWQFNEP